MKETTKYVDSLVNGEDFNITIILQEFEDMSKIDFNKSIPLGEEVLKNVKLKKEKINDIVFVGGGTR